MTDTSVHQATAAPHEAYTNRYRYYVLALLTLGYVFNFVDRQVMTILIEPIKMEFGASDTQMGLLSGLAFALFYATLGIPVARLADRWSRRNVLAISMTTWSAVTALCATATGFWHLLLLRIGVGIGEAGGTPPSQSLLADYFPPEKRAFAQGILATAPNIGILVGLFGGALIAEAYGWRSVFLVFGIPGVLLAILIQLTIKEPLKVTASASEEGAGLFSTLGNIFRLPSFAHIMVWFYGHSGLRPRRLVPKLFGACTQHESRGCGALLGPHWCFWRRAWNNFQRAACRQARTPGQALAIMVAGYWDLFSLANAARFFIVAR